jgi:hypothetical protein
MIKEGTLYSKVDPKRNTGHNTVSKFAKNFMTITGVPNARKGRVGNNGLRRDGISNLAKHKVNEAIQKTTSRHESVDIQEVYTYITQDMIDEKYRTEMLNSEHIDRIMDRVNTGKTRRGRNG